MKMSEIANIYVKNDDNLIYKLVSHEQCDSKGLCYRYNLELIAGYDYINPDENDIQGYVKAENFIDDVKFDTLLAYPMTETLKESIEENGYTFIDKLPKIY